MNLLLPSIKDFWANFIIINMFGIYLADAKSIVANWADKHNFIFPK